MSAASVLSAFGENLTPADYAALEARWITPEGAERAMLRRVDNPTGREFLGKKTGDYAGILIPNILPGHDRAREYRVRRDEPDFAGTTPDGQRKVSGRYMGPPGRPSLVYFPPGVAPELLAQINMPVVITEGELKALALLRLANYESDKPLVLPIALQGCWNWKGVIGKDVGPDGKRRDIRGVLPDFDRITWAGRKVIVAFDADAEENSQVSGARYALAQMLIGRGAEVGILEWPGTEGNGIDDRLATVGPERVLADLAGVHYGDWRTRLLRNEEGRIVSCYENVALYVENYPEWKGVVGFNEFTGGNYVLKPPPAPVTAKVGDEIEDHFDIEVVRWMERKRVMVKPDVVRRVVDGAARRHSFHPVRHYLESLRWDGVKRIGTWLIDYCGVESSDEKPNMYAMAVGQSWLISAVARIFNPGCKVDHLLILEGNQGIGKSSAARILAGDDWFTDQLSDMGSKDASMQVRGVWIVELSELDVLNRSEMARAKAFLTMQTERFRLPYGRRVIQAPRQCVFIGSTNSDVWLKDESGGRRFWPVRCHQINLVALRRDRDQLWAEAVYMFKAGVKWWLEDPDLIRDAMEEQAGRYDEDIWHGAIADFIESRDEVSTEQILQLCIEKKRDAWTQADKNRIARCLKALKWERFQHRKGSEREWRYRRPVSPVVTSTSS